MTSPLPYLVRMLLFLAVVAGLSAYLQRRPAAGLQQHARSRHRDPGRPGDRHFLHLPAGRSAVAGGELAAPLPAPRGKHAGAAVGPGQPAGADGRHAGRAPGPVPPLADGDPRRARRHRHPPRRAPRAGALPDRPADLPRPARDFLGPAADDRRRGRRDQRPAGDGRRRRARCSPSSRAASRAR